MKIILSPSVTLFHADCRAAIATLPDNSIDAVPCDPPYALTNRTPDVKWCVDCERVLGGRDGKPSACPKCGGALEYQRSVGQRGFMGKTWDTGEVAFDPLFWAEVFRVLKPGGHVAAFSASRTYHRMACAIEDAGFEIRDSLMWIYGTGFPKSMNVGKAIDASLGVERTEVIGDNPTYRKDQVDAPSFTLQRNPLLYGPATPQAAEWEGFGTALKPAFEPIVLARKPLSEGTVAANVLRWRTGALNIGACRIGTDDTRSPSYRMTSKGLKGGGFATGEMDYSRDGTMAGSACGRWPANVVTDGSDEVVGMFPNAGGQQGRAKIGGEKAGSIYGNFGENFSSNPEPRNDSGSAARFFYSAKASKQDRAGSKHPTVKPVSLMQWLARLITPPGGTILDPFAGSGTTGAAGVAEGFNVILCEREAEYVADIKRRLGRPTIDLSRLIADHARQEEIANRWAALQVTLRQRASAA